MKSADFSADATVDKFSPAKAPCKLGLDGIVSKRKDSRYRSGRSPDRIKSKNPQASAVKREAEEEWREVR